MTFVVIPNRPAGTDQRAIGLILADFDAITNTINGGLDNTNLSATAAIKGTQIDPGAGIADAVQNGVLVPGDLAISAISIATATGAITATYAATSGGVWVKNTSGVLVRQAPAQQVGVQLSLPANPASGQYAVYGVEINTTGQLSLVKGADTATQLNTASLIASNSPAVSNGKMRLYDFAVWNNAGVFNFSDHTAVAALGTNYIDRRPWARGAYSRIRYAAAGNYNYSGTSLAAIDSTNLSQRVECSGGPVRLRLTCSIQSVVGVSEYLGFLMDGAVVDFAGTYLSGSSTQYLPSTVVWDITPAAGSHLFQPAYQSGTSGQNVTIVAGANNPIIFTVEEIFRQNANNGTS